MSEWLLQKLNWLTPVLPQNAIRVTSVHVRLKISQKNLLCAVSFWPLGGAAFVAVVESLGGGFVSSLVRR